VRVRVAGILPAYGLRKRDTGPNTLRVRAGLWVAVV
jgi:hypothetical protein